MYQHEQLFTKVTEAWKAVPSTSTSPSLRCSSPGKLLNCHPAKQGPAPGPARDGTFGTPVTQSSLLAHSNFNRKVGICFHSYVCNRAKLRGFQYQPKLLRSNVFSNSNEPGPEHPPRLPNPLQPIKESNI